MHYLQPKFDGGALINIKLAQSIWVNHAQEIVDMKYPNLRLFEDEEPDATFWKMELKITSLHARVWIPLITMNYPDDWLTRHPLWVWMFEQRTQKTGIRVKNIPTGWLFWPADLLGKGPSSDRVSVKVWFWGTLLPETIRERRLHWFKLMEKQPELPTRRCSGKGLCHALDTVTPAFGGELILLPWSFPPASNERWICNVWLPF